MTKDRRQQIVLAGLLAVLVIVGGRLVLTSFGEDGGGGVTSAGQRAAGAGTSVETIEKLRIAELELTPETYELGRDPFRFVSARPQPKPRPQQPSTRQAAPPQVQAPKPRRAPARPQPPPVDVVYLGRFGSSNRPIAVFSDGREIFNVFEGGVLKGNFVVDKIGYESADLRFVGFPDTPSKRLAVGG